MERSASPTDGIASGIQDGKSAPPFADSENITDDRMEDSALGLQSQ
jgi:hypothetical protein